MFIPIIGEMIQFHEHIFQMGWFNHQLVYYHGNPKTMKNEGFTPPIYGLYITPKNEGFGFPWVPGCVFRKNLPMNPGLLLSSQFSSFTASDPRALRPLKTQVPGLEMGGQ